MAKWKREGKTEYFFLEHETKYFKDGNNRKRELQFIPVKTINSLKLKTRILFLSILFFTSF